MYFDVKIYDGYTMIDTEERVDSYAKALRLIGKAMNKAIKNVVATIQDSHGQVIYTEEKIDEDD